MTLVVYISGRHGAGKSTLKTLVAQSLKRSGLSVYVLSEFNIVPDMPIGSMEFQLNYQKEMEVRESIIGFLKQKNNIDVILCDRSPHDVDIYTGNIDALLDLSANQTVVDPSALYVLVDRDTDKIIEGIKERAKVEGHRSDWKEEDLEYLENIGDLFNKHYPMNVIVNNNGDIEEAVKIILKNIYKRRILTWNSQILSHYYNITHT